MGTVGIEDGIRPRSVKKEHGCITWTKKTLKKRVPVVEWLPKYMWKKDFMADLVSGFTIACIHIPQGLAFALLANVEPILGLYTSCFSTLVYTLLGTSHISSFGPVAIGSMLVGEAVIGRQGKEFTAEQICSLITFLIGAYYLVGFLLRLGVITVIFTKPFTSGFIAGCTLHIILKNVKFLVGLRIRSEYGYFNLYHNTRNLCSKLWETNIPTLVISLCVLAVLVANSLLLKPLVKKCTRVIVPVEALIMLLVSIFSYLFAFHEMGVPTVGHVPTGFPDLVAVDFSAFGQVWSHALMIAIVNYSTTTSMTMAFNKSLDADQDLLALAVSNIVCANLQCITIGNSMMRTAIAVTLNVRTLLSSMISSFFLFFVILFAGPVFSPLPDCVLGCIIMVGAFLLIVSKMKDLPGIFRSSLEDVFIWFVTFFTVIVVDIQFGLIAGAILALRQILGVKHRKVKDEEEKEPMSTARDELDRATPILDRTPV